MNHAGRLARANLGMELVEVRAKNTGIGHASTKTGKKKAADDEDDNTKHAFEPGKAFILRSLFSKELIAGCADVDGWEYDQLPTGGDSVVDWAKGEQVAHIGFLYVVLALIMVNGRSIADSALPCSQSPSNLTPKSQTNSAHISKSSTCSASPPCPSTPRPPPRSVTPR
jgi:hypothetical protein